MNSELDQLARDAARKPGPVGRWPSRVTFQVAWDLVDRIDREASAQQTSRHAIIRQALVEYLDRRETSSKGGGI